MRVYEKIVDRMAEAAVRRLVESTRRRLQALDDTMSGDDSPLQNIWEEICAQVQGQHSIYWGVYEHAVHDLFRARIQDEPHYVLAAIWLQTDDGIDWKFSDESEGSSPTWEEEAVIQLLTRELMSVADNYRNSRIDAYLGR